MSIAPVPPPRPLLGDRCQALVARSRSDPVWVAGRIEYIDASQPGDVRLDIRADDGRLLPACRADCIKVEPT